MIIWFGIKDFCDCKEEIYKCLYIVYELFIGVVVEELFVLVLGCYVSVSVVNVVLEGFGVCVLKGLCVM